FLIMKSLFLLAENSIKTKQKERYEAAIDAYFNFIDYFPKSNDIGKAEEMYQISSEKVETLQ
ncbi:MAG: hypothetical protein ACPG49_09110, partial [Chitinophagales bacterium]